MWCLIHCSSMVTSSEYSCQRSASSCSHSERSKVNLFRRCAKKRELMLRKGRTHVGFDTVLNIWYSGHDIIQGWDICDDGLLIWMGHIHICRNREWKNIPPLYGVYVMVNTQTLPEPHYWEQCVKVKEHERLSDTECLICQCLLSPSGSSSLVTPSSLSATLKACSRFSWLLCRYTRPMSIRLGLWITTKKGQPILLLIWAYNGYH